MVNLTIQWTFLLFNNFYEQVWDEVDCMVWSVSGCRICVSHGEREYKGAMVDGGLGKG